MAKSLRGFAAMDPETQRQIASKGGRAAHQSGNAHEFTPEEAAVAGRKGGLASHHRNTTRKEASNQNPRDAAAQTAPASGEAIQQQQQVADQVMKPAADEGATATESKAADLDLEGQEPAMDLQRHDAQIVPHHKSERRSQMNPDQQSEARDESEQEAPGLRDPRADDRDEPAFDEIRHQAD